MKLPFFCISVFISFFSNAQLTLSGTVVDDQSGRPIEFANIGVIGKGVGTVTDEKGQYNFLVPDSLVHQKVKISIIGYQAKSFDIKSLSGKNRISLAPDVSILREVTVAAKKLKTRIVGNQTRSKAVSVGFARNILGTGIAVRLNIKKPNTQLRKFFVQINSNKIERPIFRLNLYSIDEKGAPKENILKQNIFIGPEPTEGFVAFDLMPYNIYVNEDVYISLEWIKDLGPVEDLMFSAKLVGAPSWFRTASQGTWEKLPVVGVGLHAEIGY